MNLLSMSWFSLRVFSLLHRSRRCIEEEDWTSFVSGAARNCSLILPLSVIVYMDSLYAIHI